MPNRSNRLLSLLLLVPLLLPIGALAAATGSYSPWNAAGNDDLQNMVDALNRLVDQGERDRAADRRFLEDLRQLAQRYDRPWRRDLFFDDFSDGDYTANPAWSVVSGSVRVDPGYGLRSSVVPQAAADNGSRQALEDQLATAIVGAIFDKGKKKKAQEPPADTGAPAEVRSSVRITNAFALRAELTLVKPEGRYSIEVYRDRGSAGYRLDLLPGAHPAIQLMRLSRRGAGVVDSAAIKGGLADGSAHTLEWTRGRDGTMQVLLDGQRLIAVADRASGGDFEGLAVINTGGDYVLRRISVKGTD